MPASKPFVTPNASQLDTSKGDATAALYSAAIGPINNDYYLPLFTKFEESRRPRLSWNWAACLYTVNWMVFRGLGLAALAYSAIVTSAALVLFGLGHLIFQLSPSMETTLLIGLVLVVFGGPGLLGDWFLYGVVRKKMASALRESANLADACALLAQKASSRSRFLWLVSVNAAAVVAALALYGWFSLQADEPSSAQTSSLAQANLPASALADRVDTPSLTIADAATATAQSGLVTNMESTIPAIGQAPKPATSVAASASATTVVVPAATASASMPKPAASKPSASDGSSMPATKAVNAKAIPAARPSPPARQRFYINVGLFAKETNAQNALNTLETAGLPTLSGTVTTLRGERTRVRAGPFDSEREARAAAATIRTLKLDAVVIQQTP